MNNKKPLWLRIFFLVVAIVFIFGIIFTALYTFIQIMQNK